MCKKVPNCAAFAKLKRCLNGGLVDGISTLLFWYINIRGGSGRKIYVFDTQVF